VDWFIVLGPVLVLPLILLFAFVGCGQDSGTETGAPEQVAKTTNSEPPMLMLWFQPQELDTTPPLRGGSVQATFRLISSLPTNTIPTLPNAWTATDDLSKWLSVQAQLPAQYADPGLFNGQINSPGTIQCLVEYSLLGPNPAPPGSVGGSQHVGFALLTDVWFYLDASKSEWTVTTTPPTGAPIAPIGPHL
jgi:hypothetical protein